MTVLIENQRTFALDLCKALGLDAGNISKLVITLPTTPSIFVFLNREWRFTKKALPEMELAPWGTTEPLVLHMLRQ